MFTNDSLYIGIDPTAGKRPLTYAALDSRLRVVALAKAGFNDVMAFVAGQPQALIAVSSPPRPNQKLMERPEVRDQLTPPPRPGRWVDFRLVEYLMRIRRIHCPKTPSEESACPAWIRRGFQVYHRLEGMGCQPYPAEAPLQCVEVYPHASYSVLLGRRPFAKNTFEGRIQRQLCLYGRGLEIPDAMRVFEEITRHHLLHGVLPVENLYTPPELDTLVAAYTAWLAANEPQDTLLLGDASEGQVLLPAGALKNRY